MKTICKSITCLVISMLFLSAGEMKADELIREVIGEQTSRGTIIRHFSDDVDVVCYHNGSTPFFLAYVNGYTNAYPLYVDMDTITDFEIFDNEVYFCGEKYTAVGGKAAWGFFDIASLLSPNPAIVSYHRIIIMKRLKALEVGWIANRKHVMAIGEAITGEAMLLDAIDETASWSMNFSDVGADTVVLSDLAIIDSFVVVTSIRKTTSYVDLVGGTRVWFIDKPSFPGSSLFPSIVKYRDIWGSVAADSNFLVKSMDSNRFVTAVKIITWGSSRIEMSFFNGLTYERSYDWGNPNGGSYYLGDLGYDNNSRDVALLVYGKRRTTVGSVDCSMIYEIMGSYPPLWSSQAHIFDGVYFNSLDNISGHGHFVVSGGKRPGVPNTPYYMKFEFGIFEGSCLDNTPFSFGEGLYEIIPKNVRMERTSIHQVPDKEECSRKTVKIEDVCSSIRK